MAGAHPSVSLEDVLPPLPAQGSDGQECLVCSSTFCCKDRSSACIMDWNTGTSTVKFGV